MEKVNIVDACLSNRTGHRNLDATTQYTQCFECYDDRTGKSDGIVVTYDYPDCKVIVEVVEEPVAGSRICRTPFTWNKNRFWICW